LAGGAALLDGHLDQLADAGLVERLERVVLEDALRRSRAGSPDVVAAVAEGHLREVVGAEAEEVGLLGDLVGGEAARGISIMVPIEVVELAALLLLDLGDLRSGTLLGSGSSSA
jgi:hypothetical protein